MLPYLFHPAAARVAIKHKKHFFTTSYTSDFMRQLEPQAKELGLIIVNEWYVASMCILNGFRTNN
jgi:saccharopine dehydrogenase-like NADP-dependent oxidoreductase